MSTANCTPIRITCVSMEFDSLYNVAGFSKTVR